jgi:hypothetical protein
MAIVMTMAWAGIKPEDYDKLLNVVDWEGRPADGGIFHVAWFDEKGLRVVDVWESDEDWNNFLEQRLGPGLAQVGLQGEPSVEISEVHRYLDTAVARGVA